MSITKLYAGVVGDPLNTSGPALATSVNNLIDTHVTHLKALPVVANAQTGTVYNVVGFYSGTTKGGGKLVYDATASKSLHNGVTHYSPESLIAWDGTQGNLATLFSWTGAGSGCWVRLLESIPTIDIAGGDFTAIAAVFPDTPIRVTKGTYTVNSTIYAKWQFDGGVTINGSGKLLQPERGFWADIGGGADFSYFRDRVFVGDACDASTVKDGGVNKSWVGYSAGGYMTYYDTRSQSAIYSSIGGIAQATASRSSDAGNGELNTIGSAAYVKNDNTNSADKKSSWAFYGHAAHLENNEFTAGIETDTCSLQTLVEVSPYLMGASGTTAGYWLGVGGETAQQLVDAGQGSSLKNVSAAIAVINSASAATGNRFAKGIVFQATALAGTNGAGSGSGIAMEVARGHRIVGKYGSNVNDHSGQIRFEGGSGNTSQIISFETNQFLIKGFAAGFATEHNLIGIQSPSVPAGQSTNWFFFNPSVQGTGSIQTQAAGVDTNIQYLIQGKGTGGVTLRDGNSLAKVTVNTTGVSFYGSTPVAKPTVSGSRGGNAALDSLLQALANLGLITNSTT
jgi:hypothetical protein